MQAIVLPAVHVPPIELHNAGLRTGACCFAALADGRMTSIVEDSSIPRRVIAMNIPYFFFSSFCLLLSFSILQNDLVHEFEEETDLASIKEGDTIINSDNLSAHHWLSGTAS